MKRADRVDAAALGLGVNARIACEPMLYTAELIKYAPNVKKLTKSRGGSGGCATCLGAGVECAIGLAVPRGYPVRARYL